jgi:5'-methylthioadenosine phosphorylase
MTGLPEAKLAREAEICYATCAVVTDYDCWKETVEVVTAEMVVANLRKGIETVKKIIKEAVTKLPQKRDCLCASALKDALITSPELIPPKVRKDLALILDKYLKKGR